MNKPCKTRIVWVENEAAWLGNEEQVNMARAQEESQEQSLEGRIVKRKPMDFQVEVRSKKQAVTSAKLLDCERQDGGQSQWWLQRELASTRKTLSICEARLELNIRRRGYLVKDKLDLEKEKESLQGQLREKENKVVELQSEIHQLKSTWETRQQEVKVYFNGLYELALKGLGMGN